ncbi:M12 family metallopeptidase [Pseudomonas poae]|nr:M12 family metallopeptidase [Pseudomonas poae]
MISSPFSANAAPLLGDPKESVMGPPQTESLSRGRRSVGEPGKYWQQNSTIKIAMYEYEMDSPYVLAVKKAAGHWLPHINLKFEFVSGEEGDVRITQNLLNESDGRSAIGIDALNTPWSPTMSLPGNHLASDFDVTVMHEFGHMLGAHHAHQHPDAKIPWSMPRLEKLFTRQELQDNFLALPKDSRYEQLPYDANSVMHYSINANWTERSWEQPSPCKLSDGDIAWAKKAYPRASGDTLSDLPSHVELHPTPDRPTRLKVPRSKPRAADSDCTRR